MGKNKIIFLISLLSILILSLSGCGSTTPATPVNNGGPVNSGTFFKLAAGNTWKYNTATTITISGAGVASSSTFAASTTVTTGASTAAGLTPVLTNGILTSHLMKNLAGGINTYNASGTLQGVIPATINPGTTFTLTSASNTISCTIAATNATVTVPAGTFTNVVQANYSILNLPAGTTGSGTKYFSAVAGREIKDTMTIQSTIIIMVGLIPVQATMTTTITDELLPGYIALP